ncbi:uncharacterized protein [Narcine bancroftii]|uniref:uncharacterized protein n=1 Tax=Narcine bancroftii TaxID=1343680 RepID=UPI003831380D
MDPTHANGIVNEESSLYFHRSFQWFSTASETLANFYRGMMENVLTNSITVWTQAQNLSNKLSLAPMGAARQLSSSSIQQPTAVTAETMRNRKQHRYLGAIGRAAGLSGVRIDWSEAAQRIMNSTSTTVSAQRWSLHRRRTGEATTTNQNVGDRDGWRDVPTTMNCRHRVTTLSRAETYSTCRSRAVSHPSTDQAGACLASKIMVLGDVLVLYLPILIWAFATGVLKQ